MKFDPYLTPCTNLNSRWIKDVNVRAKSMKPIKENTGKIFCDLKVAKFLRHNGKTIGNKRKNKLDSSKIKNFCTSKDTMKKTKKQTTEWETIFVKHVSNQGDLFRPYKEVL